MKALVTGATGFVGSHLVDALLGCGDEVTTLVRSPARAESLEAGGVRLVRGDLSDSASLREACAGQDVVYHVAGLIAARSEAEFLEVNCGGTHRLLDAATTAAVRRFVLLSSLSAGGPSPVDRPLTGNEEACPVTAYGRSKLAGESVVRSGALPWTILRPPAVYGPADREMLRVFRAVSFGIAPVFGNGSQRLSLIFGPDLAQAIVAAGTSEGTRSGIYYPAHSEILTGREVVLTIARAAERRVRILPVPQIVARGGLALTAAVAALANRATILNPDKANEFFQPAWTCDPTSLTAMTGWRAEYDFAAGARATLEWYRAGGWL